MQEEFSLLLKTARKEAGYTQKELADILGVATGTVQQWELGTRFPRVAMLKNIENTLKIALIPGDIEEEKKRKRKEAMLGAWKAAEEKAGRKLSFDEAMAHYRFDTAIHIRLNEAIHKLNNEGRKVALERIEELTLIDKYILPDSSKYTSMANESKKTETTRQNPPEDHETASDGQDNST